MIFIAEEYPEWKETDSLGPTWPSKKQIVPRKPKKAKAKPSTKKGIRSASWRPYVGSENEFQKSVAKYLDSLGVLWNHTGNERKTASKQNKKGKWYSVEGAELKRKGVKKGFPDIMIFESGSDCGLQFNGFALELKVGKNKPSPEQDKWLEDLRNKGWKTGVYYSLDHVINDVKEYLHLK